MELIKCNQKICEFFYMRILQNQNVELTKRFSTENIKHAAYFSLTFVLCVSGGASFENVLISNSQIVK